MKETIINTLIVIAISIIVSLSVVKVTAPEVDTTKIENGETAYKCIAQGKCVYEVVARYQQEIQRQAILNAQSQQNN